MATQVETKPVEINEIAEILKKDAAPKINKKARFNPCYVGTKGAYGQVNGFFARKHRLVGGNIIHATYGEIASETKYSTKTIQRQIKQLELNGRLIVFRAWKNSYLYLPEDTGSGSWLVNFKAKYGIDLKTQIKEIRDESSGQNVLKNRTKCPQDDLSYRESFRESKTDIPKKPPEPPPQTDIDIIKDLIPKKWHYKIENLDKKLEVSIRDNGLDYVIWAVEQCNQSMNYFNDIICNREKYRKYDRKIVREGESQAIEENKKHTEDLNGAIEALPTLMLKSVDDNLVEQSLTPPTSELNLPINPKKEPAIKDENSDNEDYPQGNYSNYNCSNMDCEPIEITQKRFEQAKEFQVK